ncbi:MAG: ATP-binding protein [Oscillochloridaceae bacterium]|nr:ATP-binding protein [Chloroflexaceae bacterium]MDW8391782.1 ATP-binding protein [Oscillochloridaceae bacterium]
MSTLPRAARWYLYSLWSIALVSIIAAIISTSAPMPGLLALGISGVAYVLADYFEVVFGLNQRDRVAMTVVDAPTIFLVPTAGAYGVLVVLIGSLLVDWLRGRPWYKGLFNASQRSITFLVMVAIYNALVPPAKPFFSGFGGLVTFAVLAVTYYTLNTLLVSTILALASGEPVLRVYRASFREVRWVHFITLPFGAILAYIWETNPWLTLAAVLPLFMAYRSFKTKAALQEESQRSRDLADQATRLVDELRARQEELIRSSQLAALGTFAASVAHEFNNLLTAIYGYTQLGLSAHEPQEKDQALDVVRRACTRRQSITRGLLSFTRRREPRRELCQLNDLVRDAITLLRPEFMRLGVVIEERLQPLPEVWCDSGQITQVLLNLLTNARNAVRDQGHGQIIIGTQMIEDQIELSVRDTGVGIPAEMLAAIFQPFVTTKHPSDARNSGGAGLGLAICRTIIENHGGVIRAESEVGRGTTMTVRLPLRASLAPATTDGPGEVGFDAEPDTHYASAPHSLA